MSNLFRLDVSEMEWNTFRGQKQLWWRCRSFEDRFCFVTTICSSSRLSHQSFPSAPQQSQTHSVMEVFHQYHGLSLPLIAWYHSWIYTSALLHPSFSSSSSFSPRVNLAAAGSRILSLLWSLGEIRKSLIFRHIIRDVLREERLQMLQFSSELLPWPVSCLCYCSDKLDNSRQSLSSEIAAVHVASWNYRSKPQRVWCKSRFSVWKALYSLTQSSVSEGIFSLLLLFL